MMRVAWMVIVLMAAMVVLSAAIDDDAEIILLPSRRPDLCAGELEIRPRSCPVKCFRPDPVCGDDKVTYWCGCADARCAGAKVAKLGFCQVGNGGSAPLSAQALLLVHIVWLIVLAFSVLCGVF